MPVADLIESFDLNRLPDGFYDNPFAYYQALRESAPVKRIADGSYFLTRYADVLAVYNHPQIFSSDKTIEFKPKFGDSLLVDHVIPRVPVRQWVLSFPIPLRILFAAHPQLLTPVLQVIHRVITRFLIKQAGLKHGEADTGAVTLIQRFGSAANLNIHLHCLVLDGFYRSSEGTPVFHEARAPTGDELQALLAKIIRRILKCLTRQGYLIEEEGMSYLADTDADHALTPLQAASCSYRIALGPHAGQKVLSLQSVPSRAAPSSKGLCANAHGFSRTGDKSLHAGVRCGADQREALEHLCRTITRPAIANERLKRNRAGQVVLQLKSAYQDGTTHIVPVKGTMIWSPKNGRHEVC